ncbi:Hsp70 family protein [Aspergillus affinis]|uniref:Hsp70 family protein n=1 Tax=Aspergillus affinis TaxID=1070780 RepID=UPI0022FEE9A9|nr:uncharacterized protein KD926_000798 [Aspergillus affinis]KAI9037150.1 hypothetical protein KD926_000798 [Aspergillus affinis]
MVLCFQKSKPKAPIEVHVGIDIGTNYTGAAFATKETQIVRTIQEWPDKGARVTSQVPTTISGSAWNKKWGFKTQTMSDENVIRGFKALVENPDTDYEPAVASKPLIKKLFATPDAVMGEYLQRVIRQIKNELRQELQLDSRNMAVHYCLTVPSSSDQVRDAMKTAASRAGISDLDLSMVSESDAALMDCFRDHYGDNIRENGVVLLVDAGHRKVSVGAYQKRIKSPTHFKSLQREIEWATQFCGSAMLDDNFERFMIKLFGNEAYFKLSHKARQTAMRHWQEHIKPSFGRCLNKDEKGEVTYFVPMPYVKDDLSVGLKDGYLMIDEFVFQQFHQDDVLKGSCRAQIKGIFDPVIQQVKDMLSSQIVSAAAVKKNIEVITLVGGFGSSEYLFQQLSAAYPDLKVLQRPDALVSANSQLKSSNDTTKCNTVELSSIR